MTFEEFLSSPLDRSYIEAVYPSGRIDAYVRKSNVRPGYLDIANVSAYPMGVGLFSRFLAHVKDVLPAEFKGIFIENVLTERFANYFETRGYERIVVGGIPSFKIAVDK